jgi:hypothetical protein
MMMAAMCQRPAGAQAGAGGSRCAWADTAPLHLMHLGVPFVSVNIAELRLWGLCWVSRLIVLDGRHDSSLHAAGGTCMLQCCLRGAEAVLEAG